MRPAPTGSPLGDSCPYCLLLYTFEDDDLADDELETSAATMPERVGQYHVLELLGAGGMGSVYRARHEGLGRHVALKVLKPEFAARSGFRERFQREGRVLASLTHPHIVGVHDTGCDDGIYYLAMEYVAGSTLRTKLNAGRPTVDEALKIFGELCDALQFAHERGVVHRDIKPENVLLDTAGRAKLADFGVAKLIETGEPNSTDRAAATEINAVVGTRRYMAPEQLEFGRTIDHRADLYALAAMLYEMLTGEVPLGVFAPPSRTAGVDARLDGPILAALAKDPTGRPADARTFAAEVRAAVGADLGATTDLKSAPRTLGRRRWLAIGAATAAVALGAEVVRRWSNASRESDALAAFGARRWVHPGPVWRCVFAPDGLTVATACSDRLVRVWPNGGREPIGSVTAYAHGELGYLALAFSPNAKSFVTAGGDSAARVWDAETGVERFNLTRHSREIVDVAWSPDGRWIATAAHDKSVRLWNGAEGTPAGTFGELPDPALCVAFSPNSALLAAGMMNGAIKVWDVAKRELRSTLGHQKRVWSVAFAPGDSPRLVSGSHDRSVKIWDLGQDVGSKKPAISREVPAEGEVWSVAVSPRGDLLAAGLNDGSLRLWSFPDGQALRTVREHTESIVGVAFSADGKQLATSSLDRSAIVWDVARLLA